MKKLLLTFMALALVGLAYTPVMAAVNNTPHDFHGVAGSGADTGTRGLCEICHVPHAASSTTAKRLWRTNISMVADDGTWGKSVTGYLCGTCHYSAIGIITYANVAGQAPHVVDGTVYAGTSHARTTATLGAGATNIRDVAPDQTTRPYLGQARIQCTSCHNPHDETVRPFLRTVGSENTISKVCGGCHDRYNTAVGASNTGPVAPATGVATGKAASMHPVDIQYADQAGNNLGSGITQLHEPTASVVASFAGTNMKNAVNANYWVLGGKFQAAGGAPLTAAYNVVGQTNQIGCQTCHAIHNPAATADSSRGLYLLAIDNSPSGTNAGAALCEDCHGGGFNGVANNMYVGQATSFVDASGQPLDDHPIDAAADGTPKLEGWNGTTRYERLPTGAPVVWPFVNSGTYVPVANSNLGAGAHIGRIICTSCHSAHNAKTATSLNRSGGNATTWCFSCHLSQDMVPGNHHSTVFDKTQPSGSRGGNLDSSQIQCSDCHTGVGSPSAHMGFFNLQVATAAGNSDSELCVGCHAGGSITSTSDPVNATYIQPIANTVPNGHLSAVGGKTHYLGNFANAANSINVKTGQWMAAVKNGRGASYSKYGNTVSPVDTHNKTAPTVNGTSLVVCESCHAVLYNCGDGSLTGGYNVNLLLQNYEDNTPGTKVGAITGTHVDDGAPGSNTNVGAGLCVACHNQNQNANGMGTSNGFVSHSIVKTNTVTPLNMHPMTGWTITRAVDAGRGTTTLITGAGSYADAGTAPGAGSYDATDQMSCDGCHRPHRAADFGTWKPGYKANSVSVILESAGPVTGDYGTLCQQCHNM